MTAEEAVRTAVLAALKGIGELNGVYERPVGSAAVPHIVLGPVLGVDWGAKDRRGRELRVEVAMHDAGQRPGRTQRMLGFAAAAIEALPRVIDGWQVASIAPVRSRMAAAGAGRWVGTSEYRIRVMEDL